MLSKEKDKVTNKEKNWYAPVSFEDFKQMIS